MNNLTLKEWLVGCALAGRNVSTNNSPAIVASEAIELADVVIKQMKRSAPTMEVEKQPAAQTSASGHFAAARELLPPGDLPTVAPSTARRTLPFGGGYSARDLPEEKFEGRR